MVLICGLFFAACFFKLAVPEPHCCIDGYCNEVENIEGECECDREYIAFDVIENIVEDAADITKENYEGEDNALAACALAPYLLDDGDRPCDTETYQHTDFEDGSLYTKNCKGCHNKYLLNFPKTFYHKSE